jgi:hypothetical protein
MKRENKREKSMKEKETRIKILNQKKRGERK